MPRIALLAAPLLAALTLAACNRGEPEVVAAPLPETVQVARVTGIELAPARLGIMVLVEATDPRGTIEELEVVPRGTSAGVLTFDLIGGLSADFTGADMPGQRLRTGFLLSRRDIAGALGVRVEGAEGGAQVLFAPEG